MEGDTPEKETTGALSPEYVRKAVLFIVNAHAATVNMRLYPSTSNMVTETVDKAHGLLGELLEKEDEFSVSAVENNILVNEARLEEMEQQKAPVKSFLIWMSERGLSNIEFKKGVTEEEMRDVFQLLGDLVDNPELRAKLQAELDERGVENITVNQRVYVAVDAGDEGSVEAGAGGRKSTPLDALKDELLIRYLMGKVNLGEVEDTEMIEVLSDAGKVGGLMSRFLAEEGAEGGVLVRSDAAEKALNKLSMMVGEIEDESLRETLADQVSSIVAEMSPREMTSVLAGHSPANLDITHVRENVIAMLSDEQLMDMVDSLIDEYVDMKEESGGLDAEWLRDRLKNLNEVLLEVKGGDRGESLVAKIDQKLDEAGIAEERDAATGRRVLSADQLLGAPLEEEDVKDLGEGVDQTVSMQIRELYSMGENDLASGMLVKITSNLGSRSEQVRRFAAYLVEETLDDLSGDWKLSAARVLVPGLIESANEEEDYLSFVRETDTLKKAAQLLFKSGAPADATRIIAVLRNYASPEAGKGVELAKHAEELVAQLMGSGGILDYKRILAEEEPREMAATIEAISMLGPGALSPIVDVVKDRGQMELRGRAVDALKLAGSEGTRALTAELEKDYPWYVYRNILNVLAELRSAEAIPSINALANNPDERIRREVIRTLARIGFPESLVVVRNATNDESVTVRRTAVRVLGMFKHKSVASFLLDLIHDEGPRGKDEDQGVVEAACLALGDLGDPQFIPKLGELLHKGGLFRKGKPDEVRAAACIALGSIQDQSAAPLLEKAMKDGSLIVRSSAEKSLRTLSGAVTAPEIMSPEEIETVVESGGRIPGVPPGRQDVLDSDSDSEEPPPPSPPESGWK